MIFDLYSVVVSVFLFFFCWVSVFLLHEFFHCLASRVHAFFSGGSYRRGLVYIDFDGFSMRSSVDGSGFSYLAGGLFSGLVFLFVGLLFFGLCVSYCFIFMLVGFINVCYGFFELVYNDRIGSVFYLFGRYVVYVGGALVFAALFWVLTHYL